MPPCFNGIIRQATSSGLPPQAAEAKNPHWASDASYRGYEVRLGVTPKGNVSNGKESLVSMVYTMNLRQCGGLEENTLAVK